MTTETFEYAIKKDVRNNPIVRELDSERHREMWSGMAIGVFLVAAAVTLVAVPPSLVLDRRRRRMLGDEPPPDDSGAPEPDGPGIRPDTGEPAHAPG